MELKNLTPFMPMKFDSRDEKRNDHGVVIAQGTFDLIRNKRLRICSEQEELNLTDEYYGEPTKSSIKRENGLAPFKPNTDILVTAEAHSPSGSPQTHWKAAVAFGNIRKQFSVTGPRKWIKRAGAMELTDIQPVHKVPVIYENAFGGKYGNGENQVAWEQNPVGTGFVDHSVSHDEVRAPQILPADQLAISFGQNIETVGLGPIGANWQPRTGKAGTYDMIWQKTRWPDLPEDFSYEFYNTASSGMTLKGFADGTEKVRLTNLAKDRDLVFGLPGFELASLMRYVSGEVIPGPMFLDTIHIDCTRYRVYLTWRGVYPIGMPIRVLEIRAKAKSSNSTSQSRLQLERSES